MGWEAAFFDCPDEFPLRKGTSLGSNRLQYGRIFPFDDGYLSEIQNSLEVGVDSLGGVAI